MEDAHFKYIDKRKQADAEMRQNNVDRTKQEIKDREARRVAAYDKDSVLRAVRQHKLMSERNINSEIQNNAYMRALKDIVQEKERAREARLQEVEDRRRIALENESLRLKNIVSSHKRNRLDERK